MATQILRKFAGRALVLVVSTALMAIALNAKDKDHGYVKARGNPSDAAVFINGKYIGPASRYTVPETYEAPLGEVEITLKDPRCEDFVSKVMIGPGKKVHLHYNLKRVEPAKPPFGTLRFTGGGTGVNEGSLSGGDIGAIYINDKYFGYVQEENHAGTGLMLNPGSYDLHIDSPVFGDVRQKITIEAEKTTNIHLEKK